MQILTLNVEGQQARFEVSCERPLVTPGQEFTCSLRFLDGWLPLRHGSALIMRDGKLRLKMHSASASCAVVDLRLVGALS